MPDRSKWSESISVGFQVFAQGGDEEFGAIRDGLPGRTGRVSRQYRERRGPLRSTGAPNGSQP